MTPSPDISAKPATSDASPKVSVIIVNYNGAKWLKRCVQSVLNQTLRDFECFIVDNGSTDHSLDTLPELDARFTVIEAGENLGFAKANNLAAQKASAPWIALLNPDAFARPNWLETLRSETTKPRYAPYNLTMVGSMQYTASEDPAKPPETLDGVGDFYHIFGQAWRGLHGYDVAALENLAPDQPEVFGPCGAAALYHRDTFLRLGGFDERFFCYHEDVDIAFRMRLDGGICIQSRDAIVDHIGSGISGGASDFAIYHGTRNRLWTFVKDMPALGLWIFGLPHLWLNIAFLIWAAFRSKRLGPTWRGVRDGIKGIPMIWASRTDIHKHRKIGLFELLRVMSLSPRPFLRRANASVPLKSLKNQ